ncbi:MAG: hypothetical protein K0S71_2456 [Clostridia bacterium]|nr:hypothetical protein [Clostridia bacterium]
MLGILILAVIWGSVLGMIFGRKGYAKMIRAVLATICIISLRVVFSLCESHLDSAFTIFLQIIIIVGIFGINGMLRHNEYALKETGMIVLSGIGAIGSLLVLLIHAADLTDCFYGAASYVVCWFITITFILIFMFLPRIRQVKDTKRTVIFTVIWVCSMIASSYYYELINILH